MRRWFVPIVTTIIVIFISIVAYDSLPSQMAINFKEPQTVNTLMDKRFAVSLMPILILVCHTPSKEITFRYCKNRT